MKISNNITSRITPGRRSEETPARLPGQSPFPREVPVKRPNEIGRITPPNPVIEPKRYYLHNFTVSLAKHRL
jgi:hypothetical protein